MILSQHNDAGTCGERSLHNADHDFQNELPTLTEILSEFDTFHGLAWHQIDWALFRLARKAAISGAELTCLYQAYRVHGGADAVSEGFAVNELQGT